MAGKVKKLPITLISGFLGAGKSTILREILLSQHQMRAAVIVNDMAEVNIDAAVARALTAENDDAKVVEMQNGCICCTLRDDLIEEIFSLAESDRFDYLLIEATGISEPMPIASAFHEVLPKQTKRLSDIAELDTTVTVVDCVSFLSAYRAAEAIHNDSAERTLSDLLIEQVEFANVIVVTKGDLVEAPREEQLVAVLRALNPSAKIICAQNGKISPQELLGTKLYDKELMASHPGWVAALRGEKAPESEEYGITSFVWESRTPLHPNRFWKFLQSPWKAGEILRSKGFFWLASRYDSIGLYQQAGGALRIEHAGSWWASVPIDSWPKNEDVRRWIERKWAEPFGDRRQEIVFIGRRMDEKWIRTKLGECLLTSDEMQSSAKAWISYADPFPNWEGS